MQLGKKLDLELKKNKPMSFFFGLYPIYILFALTTIIFSNGLFVSSFASYVLMVIVTTYTVLLFAYNIITLNVKCNKLIGYSFIAFCLLAIISYFLTQEDMNKAKEYILMIPINGLVLACAHSEYEEKKRINPFIAVLIAFAITVSIWNFINPFIYSNMLGNQRLSGLTNHPARLGEMTSVGAMISLSLLILFRNKRIRILYAIFLVINCITLHYANSRGAWLAFFTGVCVFAIIFAAKYLSRKTFIACLIVLFCIVLILALVVIFSRMNIKDFSFDYSTINSLSSGRLPIYTDGLELLSEHPFMGHAMRDFKDLESNYTNTADRYHFHNIYLDIAVRYGIFACIAFAILTISIFVLAIKYIRDIDKKAIFSTSNIVFISAFAIYCSIMVQNQLDVYIFFNGYSAGNCFFYITSGIMTYFLSKKKE